MDFAGNFSFFKINGLTKMTLLCYCKVTITTVSNIRAQLVSYKTTKYFFLFKSLLSKIIKWNNIDNFDFSHKRLIRMTVTKKRPSDLTSLERFNLYYKEKEPPLSGAQKFKRFVWNPKTRQFLGRTGGSWCEYLS